MKGLLAFWFENAQRMSESELIANTNSELFQGKYKLPVLTCVISKLQLL